MAQNVNPTIEVEPEEASNGKGNSSTNSVMEAHRATPLTATPSSIGRPGQSLADSAAAGKHSVAKRLQHELLTLMTCADKGISAFPDSDYMFKWTGTIHGAADTVYEGLIYKLSLEFPSAYPYSPPTVKFVTRCFHPNVDLQSGTICLDILKEKWSALYDVRAILLSIQSLLGEPNNDSPLNPQAAELWSNPDAYKRKLNEKTRSTSSSSAAANHRD